MTAGVVAFGGVLLSTIGPPLLAVGAMIAGVATGPIALLTAALAAVGGIVGLDGITAAFGAVEQAALALVSTVSAHWDGIVSVTQSAWSAVTSIVSAAFGAVVAFVTPIVTAVWGVIRDNWQAVAELTAGVFSAVYTAVSSSLSAAWSVVSSIAQAIGTAWTDAMGLLGLASTNASTATTTAFSGIAAAAEWLLGSITAAVNLIGFGFSNMGTIAAAGLLSATLAVVRFGNQVAYVLSEVIPGYLMWIGRNWRQIFTDMANVTVATLKNVLTNAANFGKAIWSAIKGDGFSFDWTPLTDGFKTALTEMPRIAERQAGPLEAAPVVGGRRAQSVAHPGLRRISGQAAGRPGRDR